ncbi:hypothetical protein EG329_009273 [Mollisiaceae sp. DMI_Dod_QoI]|nr:hypothetical protein EG329_009273 [Helotiales sp. DMI_Dod_QoI]
MFPILSRAALALSILSLPIIHAQFVSSLPQCVQDCISQSQDDNCEVTDIKCLCRASAGNFLPDLITCMHGNCDNALDNDLLLTPLQLACQLAGVPIPASALRNAENEASSLASQVTTTVTVGGSSASGGSGATTTIDSGDTQSTVTITSTKSGKTIDEIYPVTMDSTTTISGPTSTITASHTVSLSKVFITTTNSVGSTYTFAISHPGTTRASKMTVTITTATNPTGGNSDTTTTTSVAAQETSSSLSSSNKGSKTTKAPDPDETDSAPFKDTNSGAVRTDECASLWLWLGALVSVWWAWI